MMALTTATPPASVVVPLYQQPPLRDNDAALLRSVGLAIGTATQHSLWTQLHVVSLLLFITTTTYPMVLLMPLHTSSDLSLCSHRFASIRPQPWPPPRPPWTPPWSHELHATTSKITGSRDWRVCSPHRYCPLGAATVRGSATSPPFHAEPLKIEDPAGTVEDRRSSWSL